MPCPLLSARRRSRLPFPLSTSVAPSGRPLPASVGRYRVLALLGEGGMGTVYLAEQSQPHRQIALKVIRRDLAGPRLLRRFEREAEVLGALQHPGIAQVYEAGTADGPDGPQPYIAMERVAGVPLTEHSLARGAVRGRVTLALQVCDAVHHAHQRGVIHRDLKPGNVLVDAQGRARVLDFGIARRIDVDAGSTATGLGEVLGSLAYMSPEQVAGDPLDVDVRSDVYALGVLLHELLAGRRPLALDGRSFPSALHIILNEEPPRLGTLDPALAGDLETIVAKSLEKEKEQRYASAAALADDLRRYLADEPIAARPASAAYQLRKFARRNRALAGGAALAAAALAVGTGVSTWQAVRATAAEHAAEARRGEAVAAREQAEGRRREAVAAGTLAEARRLGADSARALADRERLAAERAQRAAETSAAMARQEAARAEAVNGFLTEMITSADPNVAAGRELTVRQVIDDAARRLDAGALRRQPEVEGTLRATLGRTYLDLGARDSATAQIERAIATLRRVHGARDPRLVGSLVDLGVLARQRGDLAAAEAHWTEALAIARGGRAPVAASVDARVYVAYLRYAQDRVPEAIALNREALAIARREPGRPALVAVAAHNLAEQLSFNGRSPEALPLFHEALTASRLAHATPTTELAATLVSYAHALEQVGDLPAAAARAREAVAHLRVLHRENPSQIAAGLTQLGNILVKQDSLAAAEPMLREALGIRQAMRGEAHVDVQFDRSSLGRLLLRRSRWAEAESLFTLAAAGRRAALGDRHPAVASSLEDLASVAAGRGDQVRAEAMYRDAASRWRDSKLPRGELFALTRAARAALAQGLGHAARADSLLADVLARQSAAESSLLLVDALEARADAADALARPADSEQALLRAESALRARSGADAVRRRSAIVARLAALYDRTGRASDAASWRARVSAP